MEQTLAFPVSLVVEELVVMVQITSQEHILELIVEQVVPVPLLDERVRRDDEDGSTDTKIRELWISVSSLRSPQDKMHCQQSLTVGLCTPCQKSKLQQYNRFFFVGS